jgi:hypothetical protein
MFRGGVCLGSGAASNVEDAACFAANWAVSEALDALCVLCVPFFGILRSLSGLGILIWLSLKYVLHDVVDCIELSLR